LKWVLTNSAVVYEVAPAVSGGMDRLPLDLDAAEGQAQELARELVVVAGDEDHSRAAPDLPQKLLHDIVVRLRPVPARAQPPAVDNVADQVYRVRVDMAQHVQNEIGLTTARSKVQIRKEQRAVAIGAVGFGHVGPSYQNRAFSLCADSRVASMTQCGGRGYMSSTLVCRDKEGRRWTSE
jgi:hypothetical protein